MNLTSNVCNLDLPLGKKVQKAVLFFLQRAISRPLKWRNNNLIINSCLNCHPLWPERGSGHHLTPREILYVPSRAGSCEYENYNQLRLVAWIPTLKNAVIENC